MRSQKLAQWGLALLAGITVTGCGCGGGGGAAPPTAEDQKKTDRLSQIQDKSNGDWNKVSKEDKAYLINELAHGSEMTAKMILGPGKKKGVNSGK